MKDKIKELKYQIYLKNQDIEKNKKELKLMLLQLKELQGEKTLKRKR